ncbi:hypothetical protein NSK_007653 [Nannochloropsis salina CCMP1776]|uniref:F-box domain-containing protein n=1 Tax=Nannochloropsis salina CCMP1776 TaxID=1027361 RepID=A0A4D9CPF7_9STRA|nr:hypothetical protein NSK_007653 [Nannochloropsis salina CCMP1776]|eukprot:TFJ81010.1 hypothetical protein NSK_007653 [Nannochloropsis salina CCMP1776]
MSKITGTRLYRQQMPHNHMDEGISRLPGNDESLAIIPIVKGRPRFPLMALQFAMDEDENSDENDVDGNLTWGRDWGDDKYEAIASNYMDEFQDGVACRALVIHPSKCNGNFLHKDNLAGGRCPRATMESLPQDTIKQILRFLPAPSLLVSEMVCRLWRELASTDDAHWKDLCKRTYGLSPENFSPPPDPVKLLYMLTYSSLSEIKYGSSGIGSGRMGRLGFLF